MQEVNHWTCTANPTCNLGIEATQYPNYPTDLVYLPSRLYLGGDILMQSQYFQRVYTGLSPHQSVGITMTLILLPSNIVGNRNLDVFHNGMLQDWLPLSNVSFVNTGDFEMPGSIQYRTIIPHTDSFLKLQIGPYFGPLDNTFGFRDITISLSNQIITSKPLNVEKTSCLQTNHPKLSSSTKCPCALNQANVAGTCVDCSSNCRVCSNEFPDVCIECKLPTSWNGTHCTEDCHSSCDKCYGTESHECIVCKSGYYNYKNGTCSSTCSGEFVMRYQGSQTICERKCDAGYIWSNNAFCVSSCELPFQSYSNEYNTSWCRNPSCQNDTDYLYMNGSCSPNCSFPLVIHEDPGVQYCVKPCLGNETYFNGSCLSTCPHLFIEKVEEDVKYCFNSCEASGDFLYFNGSCSANCSFPLVIQEDPGVKYCINPCETTGDFLYYNGSCFPNCSFPLITKEDPGVHYCVKPCLGDETYFNELCLPNCPHLLIEKVEEDVKYCFNPCEATRDFLYFNGSCLSACPFPLVTQENLGVKYCVNPCETTGDFLYLNGSCLQMCPLPFITKLAPEAKYCLKCSLQNNLCVSKEDVEEVQQAAETISVLGGISGSGMKAVNALNSNSPNFITLSQISTMLLYIRYLKINYPLKLMALFSSQDSSSMSMNFGFTLPISFENKLPSQRLPEVFEEYQVHSSFLVNFWDSLITLAIATSLTLLFIILSFFTKKFKKLHFIVSKVVESTKWSLLLLVICGGFGDITFYAALELKTFYFSSFASVTSFLICWCMIALGLWVFSKALFIVVNTRKNLKRQLRRRPNRTDKWKNYQILFSEYKNDSFLKLAFMPVLLLRSSSFHFILVTFHNSPLTQISLLTLLSILMLIYLFTQQPLKSRLELVQLCLNEIIVLFLNVLVLILAILDEKGVNALDTRETIGEIIIKLNIIFTALGIFFLAIQIFIYIKVIYKTIKKMKMKKNTLKFSKEPSFHLKMLLSQNNQLRIIQKKNLHVKIHKFPEQSSGISSPKLSFSCETKPQREEFNNILLYRKGRRQNQFERNLRSNIEQDPQSKSKSNVHNFRIRSRNPRKINLPNYYPEENELKKN